MSLNKAIAGLLVILFVIFSLAVILGWSVGEEILNADAYMASLDKGGLFEVPYQLIREGEIPTVGRLLLKEGPLSVVSGDDLEAIARELAPPNWLRAQVERAIRDLVALTEQPEVTELPGLVISLSEVKARVRGEPGDRALSIAVDALPECAPDRTPLDLNSDTPVCKPPGVDLSFLTELKALLSPLVDRVPNTYRVSWQPEQREVLEDFQQAGQTLKRLQVALLLMVVLNLALLGLIWVLAVRSPAEWLRWTGVPLLLLGGFVLLAAFLIPQVVIWGLDLQTLGAEGHVLLPVAEALDMAGRDFVRLLFRPALSLGAALTGIGLLLTLVSPLFPGPPQLASVGSSLRHQRVGNQRG